MKALRFLIFSLAPIFFISCSNDEIEKVVEQKNSVINVTVNLSNMFASYNFYDSQHGITPTDYLKTFNSEGKHYIEARTLFYDSNGNLADSVVTFSTNTNSVMHSRKIAAGTYTVISTLTFADKNEVGNSYWSLQNKEKLSTATIEQDYKGRYAIMSYASKSVSVGNNLSTSTEITPAPVGSLIYMYMQNFQYKNQSTYQTVADNNIRKIAFYTKNYAIGYRLNPSATDKYVYVNQGTSNSWWIVKDFEPKDFDNSWTYFKSNLYGVFYFLSPNPLITFGYTLSGSTTFQGYGEQTYTLSNGRVYLAYWDYFQVGNPYFGLADNNHWNTYSTAKQLKLMNTVLQSNSAKENNK